MTSPTIAEQVFAAYPGRAADRVLHGLVKTLATLAEATELGDRIDALAALAEWSRPAKYLQNRGLLGVPGFLRAVHQDCRTGDRGGGGRPGIRDGIRSRGDVPGGQPGRHHQGELHLQRFGPGHDEHGRHHRLRHGALREGIPAGERRRRALEMGRREKSRRALPPDRQPGRLRRPLGERFLPFSLPVRAPRIGHGGEKTGAARIRPPGAPGRGSELCDFSDRGFAHLFCWKCNTDLKAVPQPLGRRAECPACAAVLHVCRMCRHYDTAKAKQCREPVAEPVQDKTRANFCDWFQPRPVPWPQDAATCGRGALDDLFGGSSGSASPKTAEAAKKALDDLFG